MAKQVVILGAGLGGLSAAIYSRLRGFEVLLLEQHEHLGGKAAQIELAGYRLDPGPSIVILTRIYEQVFRAAGRRMEDYLKFVRLDPISRVCFEGLQTIDLPSGRDSCERLLKEFVPEDAESFKRLMDKFDLISPQIDKSVFDHPYDRPWQLVDPRLVSVAMHFDVRRTYKELIDSMFRSTFMRSFFYGFPSYGGQTYDSKAPGALMIPYLMIQEGVFYPEGGVGAIPRALARLAAELGVEIRTSTKVTGITLEGSRVRSVQIDGGESIRADAVISNIDRLATRRWLGKQYNPPPSLSYFTVHWGVPRRIAGLAHHTLLTPKNFEQGFDQLYRHRKFPDPPIVYVNETTGIDPSTAPRECSNIFAVVTTPAMEDGLDWEAQKEFFVQKAHAALTRCGFEFSRSEVDFERVQTPRYFESQHGNYRGSLYGPDEKYRLFGGLFPLSNRDEEVSNLFFSGGSVQPGAGMPMVILSGKFAAGMV